MAQSIAIDDALHARTLAAGKGPALHVRYEEQENQSRSKEGCRAGLQRKTENSDSRQSKSNDPARAVNQRVLSRSRT
jgi:hypothetical protein